MNDAPAAPNRRLVWIVRLVFYPLAIGLIALAWHQRHANADSGVVAPPTVAYLYGTVNATQHSIVRLEDGRPAALTVPLHFACVPKLGEVGATYRRLALTATSDGRTRARLRDVDTTWDNGWHGLTDITFDSRLVRGERRATVSARLELDANGVRADCRAEPLEIAYVSLPAPVGDELPDGF